MNAGDWDKYDGMEMSEKAEALLIFDSAKFAACCNGVGSKTGWFSRLTYHLIPNTVGFVNVTAASDPHDVDFTYPAEFATMKEARKYYHEANDRYEVNLNTIISRHHDILDRWRRWYIKIHLDAVSSHVGWEAFIAGRTVAGKFIDDPRRCWPVAGRD